MSSTCLYNHILPFLDGKFFVNYFLVAKCFRVIFVILLLVQSNSKIANTFLCFFFFFCTNIFEEKL